MLVSEPTKPLMSKHCCVSRHCIRPANKVSLSKMMLPTKQQCKRTTWSSPPIKVVSWMSARLRQGWRLYLYQSNMVLRQLLYFTQCKDTTISQRFLFCSRASILLPCFEWILYSAVKAFGLNEVKSLQAYYFGHPRTLQQLLLKTASAAETVIWAGKNLISISGYELLIVS